MWISTFFLLFKSFHVILGLPSEDYIHHLNKILGSTTAKIDCGTVRVPQASIRHTISLGTTTLLDLSTQLQEQLFWAKKGEHQSGVPLDLHSETFFNASLLPSYLALEKSISSSHASLTLLDTKLAFLQYDQIP